MPKLDYISLIIVAYFLGAVPFSVIISKLKGIDLTKIGSGNYGATNVYRAMGLPYAVIVFLLDAAKGYLPVTIALSTPEPNTVIPLGIGFITVLAHTFSVFVKFRGGRGVATSLGVLFALSPDVCLIAFGLGILIIKFTRIVSLASVSCSLLVPVLLFLFSYPKEYVVFFSLIAAYIVFKHIANIKRLFNGSENRV